MLQSSTIKANNVMILTTIEKEILLYLVYGFTHKDIANKLKLPLNAVKENIKSIYQKMNAHNRIQVILRAIQLNIIKKEDECININMF